MEPQYRTQLVENRRGSIGQSVNSQVPWDPLQTTGPGLWARPFVIAVGLPLIPSLRLRPKTVRVTEVFGDRVTSSYRGVFRCGRVPLLSPST